MSQIKLEINGNIAILQINRPEALNALSRELIDQLGCYLDEIAGNKDISVLVIYGEKNFAAGADLKELVNCTPEEAKNFAFTFTLNEICRLPIPTIAAIEGYALGGGLELALTCDLRIASRTAKLGLPEITLGIMPGAGGTIHAPRLLGTSKAKELIFTGDIISGEEALAVGLINRCVEPDAVFSTALELAEKLARRPAIALQTAKATISAGADAPSLEAGLEIELNNWATLFSTSDQKEGMTAFIEKRAPIFRGI